MASAAEIRAIPRIFRYFREQNHADALVQGNVYVSTLSTCRKHETAGQGDVEEGTERYYHGPISTGDTNFAIIARRAGIQLDSNSRAATIAYNARKSELLDAFVICTTEQIDSDGVLSWGRYCVEIG